MSGLFTPRNRDGTKRFSFQRADVIVISGDIDQRTSGFRGAVFIHGHSYRIFGAACILPDCWCDAIIDPEPPEEE